MGVKSWLLGIVGLSTLASCGISKSQEDAIDETGKHQTTVFVNKDNIKDTIATLDMRLLDATVEISHLNANQQQMDELKTKCRQAVGSQAAFILAANGAEITGAKNGVITLDITNLDKTQLQSLSDVLFIDPNTGNRNMPSPLIPHRQKENQSKHYRN